MHVLSTLADDTKKRAFAVLWCYLRRFGDHVTWYVPLGLKAWFQAEGITNVIELDWWQEVAHHGSRVKIVMTPAQHWSARGILDRRQTLWGGYAVIGQHQRVWFAGVHAVTVLWS